MRKRLIVCFDGTWNNADSGGSETNVQRIARAIRANSGGEEGGEEMPQIALYLRGVGSTGRTAQRVIAGAIGEGVDDNIRSAYMFLAQNYVPAREEGGKRIEADEIFLFGFSRGAFTARSLAGFIGSTGLLKRQKLGDLAKAWMYYQTEAERSSKGFCKAHRSDCHHDPEIRFLGVWDTVGALGVPAFPIDLISREKYRFHNTSPSAIVKHACHALAIDEFRDEFVPTLWTGKAPQGTEIQQVWFAGAHSDVGGGYDDRRLADIPLVWMAQKAEACGLRLDWTQLPDPDRLDPAAPQHESRFNLSRKDRLSPTFRQIADATFDTDLWEERYFPVDEQGRAIPTINEAVHPSAAKRFGQDVLTILGEDGRNSRSRYAPKNLEAYLKRPQGAV